MFTEEYYPAWAGGGVGWWLVSRGGNLAYAVPFKPGALAQVRVFLEERASFSKSNKCSVWDSGSPLSDEQCHQAVQKTDQRMK